MQKKLFAGLAAVVLALGLSGLSGCGEPAPGPPIATMSKYNQIQVGMTYSQVSQIVGNPGSEEFRPPVQGSGDSGGASMGGPGGAQSVTTNNHKPSTPTANSYRWTNDDGSFMSCIFQNDKLTSKSQSGLK